MIKSCLYGAFHCTRCVVPSMKERKWGRIVNISSSVGERGYPGDSAYGAAKAGLLGFTKSLAREMARDGIMVTAVIPGFVLTEMTGNLSPDNIELIKASIPVGEAVTLKTLPRWSRFWRQRGTISPDPFITWMGGSVYSGLSLVRTRFVPGDFVGGRGRRSPSKSDSDQGRARNAIQGYPISRSRGARSRC